MGTTYQINAAILQAPTPRRLRWLAPGQLEYDQDGVIRYCGRPRRAVGPVERVTVPPRSVIIPGLVDCHIHLSQFHVRGRAGYTLMEWLRNYIFPEEQHFRDRSYARSTSRTFFQRLLSQGTTCAAVYANYPVGVETAFAEGRRAGFRGIIGYTLMDLAVPKNLRQRPERAIGECRALLARHGGGDGRLLRFSINPRFVPACSPRFLKMLGEFAQRHDVPVQTHLSENVDEIRAVRAAYPRIRTYTHVYDHFGLLTPRTLLAHCIHLSKAERELIRRRGCGVIHCPSSNLFLHSGRFPVEHWRDYPKLGLATDVGAGPSYSMMDIMRDAYYVNSQGLVALLHYATMGGAATLGLGDRSGSLEPGKEADFVVFRIPEHAQLPPEHVLSHLIFKWDQIEILQTFVRGTQVWSR